MEEEDWYSSGRLWLRLDPAWMLHGHIPEHQKKPNFPPNRQQEGAPGGIQQRIQPQTHPQIPAEALPGNQGSSPRSCPALARGRAGLCGIPLPLPGLGYLWAELRLHQGEVFVQLLPQDGPGEAPVGVDGVDSGHLPGHQPGVEHSRGVRGEPKSLKSLSKVPRRALGCLEGDCLKTLFKNTGLARPDPHSMSGISLQSISEFTFSEQIQPKTASQEIPASQETSLHQNPTLQKFANSDDPG